jgi:hypothetical protein
MSLEKSLTASRLRSPEMTTSSCAWSCLGADLHGGLHQRGDLAAQAFHLGQALAHLLDGQAGVVALRKLAASISCDWV